MADLSGYPILRLDHIPLLDNVKLSETEVDAGKLLQELSLDSPTPPLVFYLLRQLEAIRTEISTRTAKERIQLILNGGEMTAAPERAPVQTVVVTVTTPRVTPVAVSTPAKPEPVSNFKPLPLPAELARQRSLSAANENDTSKYVPSLLTSKSNANSTTNLFSSSAAAPAPLAPSGFQATVTPSKLSSRSTGSEHMRGLENGITNDDNHSETSSYYSGGEAVEGRRRRPLSGVATAAAEAPSKQAQLVINQRFGSEFIVAATGRRKRFYPKKQPTETPEEIKTRERLERRKVAMQRLLERREKNQEELNKRKELKRAQVLKKQASQKASSSAAADDESSEESVSGGEAEGPVVLDPKMVENVAQSDISQLTELVTSRAKADATITERASSEVKPDSNSGGSRHTDGIGAMDKSGSGERVNRPTATESSSYDVTSLSSKSKPRPALSGVSTTGNNASVMDGPTKSTKGPRKRDSSASPSPITASSGPISSPSVIASTRKTFSGAASTSNGSVKASGVKSTSAPSTAVAPVAEKPSTRITPQEREALEALANIQKSVKEKDRSRSRTGSITSAVSVELTEALSSAVAAASSPASPVVAAVVVLEVPTSSEESSESAVRQDAALEGELSTKNNAALMSLRALRAKKELAKQQSSGDLAEGPSASSGAVSDSCVDEPNASEVPGATAAAVIDSIVLSDTSVEDVDSPVRFKEGVFSELDDEPTGGQAEEVERMESKVEENDDEQGDDDEPQTFNLQKLISRSSLLYCEGDYNSADSEMYFSRQMAEALPGLDLWKMDKASGVWTLDLSSHTLIPRPDLFESRASMRRVVSRGLLLLLVCCEDLLYVSPVTDKSLTEEDLLVRWRATIDFFDDLAHSVSQQDELFLFESVSVCGNCHSICKKLERLLRTYFVGDSEGGLNEEEDGVSGSAGPSRVGTARATLRLDSDSVPASPSRSPDRPVTSKPTTAQSTASESAEAATGGMVESASSLEILRAADMLEDTIPSDLKVTAIAAATAGVVSDSESESDDRPSESTAIVRPASRQTSSRQDPIPSASDAPSALDPFASNAPSSSSSQAAAPTDLRKLKKSASAKTSAVTAAAGAVKPLSLSEFYPHIGLIFPVAYNLMDSSRGGTNDGLTARTLIESMQVQAKVYEEWMEVMSDYSTVFSEERNVNENYGATEGTSTGSAAVYKGGSRSLHYRVKSSRSEVYNIVTDVFNNLLPCWEELPAGLGLGVSWNILWTWSKPRINMTHLLIWQKVNHFHDSKQLTRKDLLKKNLQRFTDMSSGGGSGGAAVGGTKISANSYSNSDFEIMPQTFVLPHEYTQFVAAFSAVQMVKEAENLQNYWIMKPVGLSRGRGISLIKDLNELSYSQSSVVQRYIERPLCLSGYKFDLRLFVLVTSFKPLEAFIYRDGFARVSTHAYSLDPENMNNKFIHLTNSSIQKQNLDGPSKDNPLRGGVESGGGRRKKSAAAASQQDTDEDEEGAGGERGGEIDNDSGGSKIGIQGSNGLWKRLEAGGINTAELWKSICTLVVKSLVVVDEKMVHQPCCFELFGYDVLIDSDLRPWLLEVNASPSLARENALDTKVKNAMIRDIFHLLDPAPYDRAAVVRVLKRRLNSLAKNKYTMGRNDPELEKDLKDILGEYVPRRYGEIPKSLGNYEMLCPDTKIFTQVMKLKRKIIKS